MEIADIVDEQGAGGQDDFPGMHNPPDPCGQRRLDRLTND